MRTLVGHPDDGENDRPAAALARAVAAMASAGGGRVVVGSSSASMHIAPLRDVHVVPALQDSAPLTWVASGRRLASPSATATVLAVLRVLVVIAALGAGAALYRWPEYWTPLRPRWFSAGWDGLALLGWWTGGAGDRRRTGQL